MPLSGDPGANPARPSTSIPGISWMRVGSHLSDGATMKDFILRFIREEEGQDLVEYTLLLAFVGLAATALFINTGTSTSKIWTSGHAERLLADSPRPLGFAPEKE